MTHRFSTCQIRPGISLVISAHGMVRQAGRRDVRWNDASSGCRTEGIGVLSAVWHLAETVLEIVLFRMQSGHPLSAANVRYDPMRTSLPRA